MTEQKIPKTHGYAFQKLAQLSLARSYVFSLMAYAFFEPTEDLVTKLVDGTFFSELSGYFRDLTQHRASIMSALDPLKEYVKELSDIDETSLLHELRVEYTRLFIGPVKMIVPPYETFYAPDNEKGPKLLVVSQTAMSVEAAYREAGLVGSDDHREPADHFATEMEFLYFISKMESDAWMEDDNNAAKKWRRRQLVFLDGHLAKWGCEFCQAVSGKSLHPFYQAMGHFGEIFIQLEGSDAIGTYNNDDIPMDEPESKPRSI